MAQKPSKAKTAPHGNDEAASEHHGRRTCVLVLGMHRSGTSAAARVVNLLGAALPQNLLGAGPGNEIGHWEPIRLMQLHDQMLVEAGSSWDDWRKLDLESQLPEVRLEFYKAEIRRLIEEEFGGARLFVLKEPRICRFVPLYRDVLGSLNIDIRPVLMLRNPLSVAASLQARNEFDGAEALPCWLRHVLDAEAGTRDLQRCVISYEALLDNWQETLQSAISALKVEWPVSIDQASSEISRFLSADQQHHSHTSSDLDGNPYLSDWIKRAYRAMEMLCVDPQKARSELDAVTAEFNPVAALFHVSLAAVRNSHKEWADAHRLATEESLAALRTKADEAVAESDEATRVALAKAEESEARFVQAQAEAEELRRQVVKAKQQLATKSQDIKHLRQTLGAEVEARKAALAAALAEMNDRLKAKDAEYARAADQTHSDFQEKYAALESRAEIDLAFARSRLEELRKQVELVRGSKSYRLGQTVMVPTRKLLDKIQAMLDFSRRFYRLFIRILNLSKTKRFRSQLLSLPFIMKNTRLALRHPHMFLSRLRFHEQKMIPQVELEIGPVENGKFFSGGYDKNTLVSVIIVNFNGKHHLSALFESLARQTHTNFETIVVDNASADGSCEFIEEAEFPVRLVRLSENVGFAEGNNIGTELARGDLLLYLNNDMSVAPNFIEELMACLNRNVVCAAVGPKMRFYKKFAEYTLDISRGGEVLIDTEELNRSFKGYPKFFFKSGFSDEKAHEDSRTVRRVMSTASLWLPEIEGGGRNSLRLRSVDAPVAIAVESGGKKLHHNIPADRWIDVNLDALMASYNWVVNNAGSYVTENGDVGDRGFGTWDAGQWEYEEQVSALCGGALLLRREALSIDEPVFPAQYFAYFEDTDLSLRLRRKGYVLMFCPSAVVYHKHASTSGENSLFFRFYVNRNRQLFFATNFPREFAEQRRAAARDELNHLCEYYRTHEVSKVEKDFAEKIPEIFADWHRILPSVADGTFYKRKRHFPRIAVYNSFWNSLGGGEYHAAVFAEALQEIAPVDLISEHDFQIEDIEKQFNVRLYNCSKRIIESTVLHHRDQSTAVYDLFVNSTFSSDLVSRAKLSYYIVSFPFRIDTRQQGSGSFISSYDHYLANSEYTKEWCRKYWNVDAKVVYPSSGLPSMEVSVDRKIPYIINIGRFFRFGHSKKQLEMAQVFRTMVDRKMVPEGWTLVLAGKVEAGHEDYFDEVRRVADGYPIELRPNVSRRDLDELLVKSAIYWHATGLDEDLDAVPDRAEHFGIAIIEAMAYGCVPVVINSGGPPEIVSSSEIGFVFDNRQELMALTSKLAELFASRKKNTDFARMMAAAQARAGAFSKQRLHDQFLNLIAQAGMERPETMVPGQNPRLKAGREHAAI